MESSHVNALHIKHQGLEQKIRQELRRPAPDERTIQHLKKQKLRIKEEIAQS